MNKLLRVVVVNGIVVVAGCAGPPVPPKGTLDCDSGRCRDGGADLRIDRAPPQAVDVGANVDIWARQDTPPIAVDVSARPDSPTAVDVGRVDATAPDTRLLLDQGGPPDLPVDVAIGVDTAPDVAVVGPDASPDIASGADAPLDALPIDTTPALDLADEPDATSVDVEIDTTSPDVESDTAPACPGALCDDFEDGDSTGWTIIGDGVAADWAVALDGANHVFQQNTDTNATLRFARAGQVSWTDQTVTVRFKVLSYGAAASGNRALVCARTVNVDSAYCLAVSADGGGTLTLLKRRPQGGGTWATLGSPVTGVGVAVDTWHTIQLVVSGSSPVAITAYLDPTGTPSPTLSASDTTQTIVAGYAAVGTEGAQAAFDDVLVTIP